MTRWRQRLESFRGEGAVRPLALLALLLIPARAGWGQEPSPAIPPTVPPPPPIKASAAILVDMVTGTVLYQRSAHQRRPNASTTKIMTAIVILESGRLQEQVVISKNAIATEYANLSAHPGERIPLSDLLYPLLMRSSNDACVAAAEHLCGSPRAMADAMNRKVLEMGLKNTHFVTVNGLYDPQHYSSAADLAQMARYASQLPEFNEIVACRKHVIRRSLNKKDAVITNRNKFLNAYSGADGIKTGYVRQSGRCLVASATRVEGQYPWRLVTVVLNSPDPVRECSTLLDYGFQNFEPVFFARRGQPVGTAKVSGGTAASVPLVAQQDVLAVLPRGTVGQPILSVVPIRSLAAPLAERQVAGKIYGYLNGQMLSVADAGAGAAVARRFPFWPWTMVLLGMVLVPRYARALAKGARRRRRRLPATGRGADRPGPRGRGWAPRARAGNSRRPRYGDDYRGWPADPHARPPHLPRPG
ncbi:MAG: D-alanyl-D-alanine carboxypeptidase [Armatimonadetes bacterium]|nr:D-alanyl-D-alanine carboxypeptidase [Armatimonadota bacterium]